MNALHSTPPVVLFDEPTHTYTVNGRRLPSVTQVIDRYNDFSMIDEGTLENARERGRLVHLVTQLHDEHDLDEETVDDELMPYLAGWKKFLAETNFQVRFIEERLADPILGYAGTLDRRGSMIRADWVLDIKAAAQVPITAGIQTAAYRRLVPGVHHDHIRRGTVQLKKDGDYRFLEWKREDDFVTFAAMLNVHRWLSTEDKRGG